MAGLTGLCFKGFTCFIWAAALVLWSLGEKKEGDTLGTPHQYPYYFILKERKLTIRFEKKPISAIQFYTFPDINRFFFALLSPNNTLNPEIILWICLNHDIWDTRLRLMYYSRALHVWRRRFYFISFWLSKSIFFSETDI